MINGTLNYSFIPDISEDYRDRRDFKDLCASVSAFIESKSGVKYRELNAEFRRVRYPLEDILQHLEGCSVIRRREQTAQITVFEFGGRELKNERLPEARSITPARKSVLPNLGVWK